MSGKLTIHQAVQGMLKLQDSGDHATMIGIGPMSSNLLQAAFELARDEDFPLMFIASRNQVDMDEFGAGYVNNWDQGRFAADIRKVADEVGYSGPYYLCRDHGGPWQRDEERGAHIPEDEAMDIARRSFVADMEAGFNLLMIDPTKDSYQIGKVIPLDVVLRRTIDLIDYLETYHKEHGLPERSWLASRLGRRRRASRSGNRIWQRSGTARRHLTATERESILCLRAQGCGIRQIARALNRSP